MLSPEILPSGACVTFQASSFFSRNGQNAILPSPHEILAKSAVQHPQFIDCYARPPVRFPELGLLVKFGTQPKVTIAEGQCLWALRRALPGFPSPEIYGWVQYEDLTFLFMELIGGLTLEQRWADLTQSEHKRICEELQILLDKLRQLRQEPEDSFIGTLTSPSLYFY